MREKISSAIEKENPIYTPQELHHPMDSTKELVSSLVELGLNKYEARVYLALVSEGTSSAKNVSDITGIPYGKVYEVINSLSGKGFCVILPTKPMRCKANPPRSAMQKAREEFHNKFQKIESHINTSLDPLFEKSKQFSDQKGFIWVINGRSNVIKKTQDLINEANKSIIIYTTENGLRRLAIYKDELERAKQRGVDIKIAGPITKANLEDLQALLFCDIRQIDHAPTHFFSFDSEKCLVVEAVPDDDSIIYGRDLGVWVLNSAFTNFIEEAVQQKFGKAKPLR